MLVKLIVTVLGVVLIFFVNWYFLFSKKEQFIRNDTKGEFQGKG